MGLYQIPSSRGLAGLRRIAPVTLFFINFQVHTIRKEAEARLRRYTPYGTGFMRQMVRTWGLRIYSRGGWRFFLGWRKTDFYGKRAFYPPFVEHGTGIFGPRHKPIRPIRASRLAWRTKGGKWVSAREVKGQPGRHMLWRTAKEMRVRIMLMMWQAFRMGFAAGFK